MSLNTEGKSSQVTGQSSVDASDVTKGDSLELYDTSIETLPWYKTVNHASAGAVVSFIGTTRDTFQGKKVVQLEYEAYKPMALLEMRRLRDCIRKTWDGIVRVLIVHRLGIVPVGEASVIIAVSSVHRPSGLEAVDWAINELKRRVPIWKKEVYEDGSEWKGNCEYCPKSIVTDMIMSKKQHQEQPEQQAQQEQQSDSQQHVSTKGTSDESGHATAKDDGHHTQHHHHHHHHCSSSSHNQEAADSI